MKKLSFIECVDCKRAVPKNSQGQKYCAECSSIRDRARKNAWANKHPSTKENVKRWCDNSRSSTKEAGKILSRQQAQSIVYDMSGPDLLWIARISVPFTWTGSKNSIWSTNSKGHVYARKSSTQTRSAISYAIKLATKNQRIAHNKLWIDVLVQKDSHRGDAVNFVDLICDAIKDAIPLDDRWYSIRRLDWEIIKDDPKIFIGIGQDSLEDMCACSSCGRIQPLSAYGKNSSALLGVDRNCTECRSEGVKLRRPSKQPSIQQLAVNPPF